MSDSNRPSKSFLTVRHPLNGNDLDRYFKFLAHPRLHELDDYDPEDGDFHSKLEEAGLWPLYMEALQHYGNGFDYRFKGSLASNGVNKAEPADDDTTAEKPKKGSAKNSTKKKGQKRKSQTKAKADPDDDDSNSWDFIDLGPYLRGEARADPPTMLPMSVGDGYLLYRSAVHWVYGEPESGKSWLGFIAAATEIAKGHHVIYYDLEDDPDAAVERLLALGATAKRIDQYFHYASPEEKVNLDYNHGWSPALVVVDSVTAVLAVQGFKSGNDTDIDLLAGILLRPFVKEGATVLVIDHVIKDRETRGRWPTESQRKLGVSKVGMALRTIEELARGGNGLYSISVTKDRPGHLRPMAPNPSKNGMSEVAWLRIDSKDDGSVVWSLEPPPIALTGTTDEKLKPFEERNRRIGEVVKAIRRLSKKGDGGPGWSKSKVKESMKNVDGAKRGTAIAQAEEDGAIVVKKVGQSHLCLLPDELPDEDGGST